MFIDEVIISVRSGKGGDGAVHFHREKYVARGGPDGGDGGRGGDVIFEVIPTLNTFSNFRKRKKFFAEDGKNGGSNNMTGRSAEDLRIPVPPGTIVYENKTNKLLGDLISPGQYLVVCKGGRGGRGNTHFATSRNQAPRTGEKGEPGQERELRLELKLLADVGLIGLPNVGKSSLLEAVTNAKPKIADYPFTTLEPNLGVVELNDETSLIIADIPGLIEGAHKGAGLGDTFLRHIQRTKVIIHMIDGQSLDPIADLTQINSELALFDSSLAQKPQVVAINKIDLIEVQPRLDEIRKIIEEKGFEVYAISALTRTNLNPLLWRVTELLLSAPEQEIEEQLPVYQPTEDRRDFSISRVPEGWMVKGAAIERSAAMTYWEYRGSLRRFQRLLDVLGVDEALREAGVQEGDTVYIGNYDYELEWVN